MPQSFMGVPIIVGEKVLGVIDVQSYQEHVYDDSQVRLLSTLASSMGVALENARLFNETQRLVKAEQERVGELQIINSIQQGLAAELDFQAIVDLVGNKLSEVLQTQDLGIRWYDEKTNLYHSLYEYEHGERLSIPPEPPSPGSQFDVMSKTRQPIVFNTAEEGAWIGVVPGTDASKSGVIVPIISKDRVIGTIITENYEREHAFGEAELRLLTTIAASLGTALENARLFNETQRLLEETRQRTSELEIINSVQQALASQLDMQAIYRLVGDKIRDVFNAHAVAINSYDRASDLLTNNYMVEKGRRHRVRKPWRPGGIGRAMLRTRQPVLIARREQFEQFGSVTTPGTQPPKSGLFVPLLVGGEVTGTISLQNVDQENAFGEADVRLLSTLASSMSVALENARLFSETQRLLQETQQRTTELEIISSVQQALASQLDLQAIYDLVGDKLRDVFAANAQSVTIGSYDRLTDLVITNYLCERGQRYFPEPEKPGPAARDFIREPRTLLFKSPDDYTRAGWKVVPGTEMAKSGITVPLYVGDEARAAIDLQNVDRENAFDEADLRLLTTLASSMSVALENEPSRGDAPPTLPPP